MLTVIAQIFYFVVIALHLYFALLEMVFWKKKAPRVFGVSQEFASSTAALASNQGLYNLFLVAALVIGLYSPAFNLYGLGCVVIAGLWGAITVNKHIFLVQALPALITLALFFVG